MYDETAKITVTPRDLDDFLSNPAWKLLKERLKERREALINDLLKLDVIEAKEANLINQLLDSPSDLRVELNEEGET